MPFVVSTEQITANAVAEAASAVIAVSAPDFERKLCAPDTVSARVRCLPRPLVMTNGVFDLLHRGHVSYLAQAREQGAALLVAVNTDASARRLRKGPRAGAQGTGEELVERGVGGRVRVGGLRHVHPVAPDEIADDRLGDGTTAHLGDAAREAGQQLLGQQVLHLDGEGRGHAGSGRSDRKF